jgi:hypothetical protein
VHSGQGFDSGSGDRPPLCAGCNNTGDSDAPLRSLDRLRGDSWCHVIWLVLGFRLERKQSTEFVLDLRAIGPRLAEQREDLIVVLTCRTFAEAGTADGVSSIDAGVDRQAGRRDVPAGLDLVGSVAPERRLAGES